MKTHALSIVAVLLAVTGAHAADAPKPSPTSASAPTATASPAPEKAEATQPGEPKVERIVNEDKATRIEELRVRGQTQRIVVKSKLGVKGQYEVVPAESARDVLPPDANGNRGAAGQAVWSVLSF